MGSIRLYLMLTVIALGIVALQTGAYYYFQKTSLPSGSCRVAVCTLISYGNATMRWYNETSIVTGWNFYNLTLFLTGGNVDAQFYGPLSEHLVTGINGVNGNGRFSWSIWIFCGTQNGWLYSAVGADEIQLSKGVTLAWSYGTKDQPPVPGAKIVDSCS